MSAEVSLSRELLGARTPVEAARRGLPYRALSRVGAALFGEDAERESTHALSKALGVSERTLARRRAQPSERLSPALSDRLLLVAETYDLAVRALEDEARARSWLLHPHPRLEGETPMDRLDTLAGAREVQTMLYHIDYGMPA